MAPAARAVTDPLGVVIELIGQVEPGLQTEVIGEVVTAVAPGRNVRRRLAQALTERPGLLADGRSPAPRVVGSLLIALRRAGAVNVSAPACAGCAKALGSMQRRGQDWFCGACGPSLEACAGCGKTRRIACRDRAGQPLCHACRVDDGAEAMRMLQHVISAIDPELAAESIATAAVAAARPGQRRHLAWALTERPELLTGAGAQAPMPAVLRLIDALVDAGANGIVHPPCPRCGRLMTLSKILDGVRVCRTCLAKARAQTCSRCGVHREPATRDEHGRPLCPSCLSTDPINQETCCGCGRRRPVSVRTGAGPLCGSCRPVPTMTCSICTRSAPAVISKLTGRPCCRACLQRRARCSGCEKVKPIRAGSLAEPLCATCTRPDVTWHACPGCGEPSQLRLRSRRCARCSLRTQLDELLGDGGRIHPQLQCLHEHLVGHDRPATVLSWLNKRGASTVLRELATGGHTLSHAILDELPDGKALRHLRSVLVATGALPPRDEHLARLEHWLTATLAGLGDLEQRALLHRYAVWHLLHRLRRRNNTRPATHGQAVAVQQHVRAAITLIDWLTAHDRTLATAGQADLDTWLISEDGRHRREAGHFVRWAHRQKLTGLEFAATRWDGPTRAIDTEARWAQARRLLHEDDIDAGDRVAGLLVLLYAQWPAAISHLTLAHVHDDEHRVRLRLGREPITLPEPLDALVRELVASRRGHASLGDQGTSSWLFPGGRPGQPISAAHLGERLRQLGLRPGQDRSTALFGLATELPAAMLARLLGIHISVAVAWQRASSGDWTSYAADYSRRSPTISGPLEPAAEPGD